MSETTASAQSLVNTVYPFTCAPKTLNGQLIPSHREAANAMATEIAADFGTGLDARTWNTLLTAIQTGLPVVITERDGVTADGRVRTITGTHIVEYAVVGDQSTSRLRLRSWGFGSYHYTSKIISVTTPDVDFGYLDAEV